MDRQMLVQKDSSLVRDSLTHIFTTSVGSKFMKLFSSKYSAMFG